MRHDIYIYMSLAAKGLNILGVFALSRRKLPSVSSYLPVSLNVGVKKALFFSAHKFEIFCVEKFYYNSVEKTEIGLIKDTTCQALYVRSCTVARRNFFG